MKARVPAAMAGAGAARSWPTADLVGARAVNDPTATNLVQIVLGGSSREGGHGILYMPDFGSAYSDTEVAAVANYVTARFGSAPSSVTAANVAAVKRGSAIGSGGARRRNTRLKRIGRYQGAISTVASFCCDDGAVVCRIYAMRELSVRVRVRGRMKRLDREIERRI